MLKQISAGVVVYREFENHTRHYLLLQYPGKYWDFPKGKLEKNERWIDAAIRETKEETGLDLEIENGFEYIYNYNFNDFKGNRINKTVLFFVGKTLDISLDVILSHEHIDYIWLPYQQARMQIYFESVRNLIDKAEAFLNRKNNK